MAAPGLPASNLYAEQTVVLRDQERARSSTFSRVALDRAEIAADFLTGATGVVATYKLSAVFDSAFQATSLREIIAMALAFGLFVAFLYRQETVHCPDGGLLQIRQTEQALRIPIVAWFLLEAISTLLNQHFSLTSFLIALIAIPALFVVQKHAFFSSVRKLLNNQPVRRAVVYGSSEVVRGALSTLAHSPRLGIEPVAVIDHYSDHIGDKFEVMGYRGRRALPVQPGPVTPALLAGMQADLLLLDLTNISAELLASATRAAKQVRAEVGFLYVDSVHHSGSAFIGVGDDLLCLTGDVPDAWYYSAMKRAMDLVLSFALLTVLAPLLLLIAALIRFDSPGPALFVQKRVGRNGALFSMYKFRTMYVSVPKYELSPATSRDRRITRIGRLLRRTSLDELPQLINVLLGNMSLVGPRPEMPFVVDSYDALQRKRLEVAPGITGLWQLSADRAFPIHQNILYDLYYIRHRGLFTDLAILIHTLFFAVSGGI